MGWYLRKGFRFGPVRVNLSKSGLGASFGVKGLRVSTGPKGPQLNAGRDGLYYRTSLPPAQDDVAEDSPMTDGSRGQEPSRRRSALATGVAAAAGAIALQVGAQLVGRLLRGTMRRR